MENGGKTIDISERLRLGEKVVCNRCGKGVYMPYSIYGDVDILKCYHFVCDQCGDTIHFTPGDVIVT